MNKLTKEQLAADLNGRQYGSEITEQEKEAARLSGLVVLFGYSDDNAEFRGAIDDEVSCYNGGDLFIYNGATLSRSHEDRCECAYCGYEEMKKKSAKIEAVWGTDGYSWTYKTAIPHATFEVMEDGGPYCRGIVFALNKLK